MERSGVAVWLEAASDRGSLLALEAVPVSDRVLQSPWTDMIVNGVPPSHSLQPLTLRRHQAPDHLRSAVGATSRTSSHERRQPGAFPLPHAAVCDTS